MAAFALVVVMGLVVLVFSVAAQNDTTEGAATTPVAGGRQTPPTTWPATTRTTTPVTTTTVDSADAAKAALERQLAADRPSVEAAVGVWMPQLSSKKLGLVVNGQSYGYLEIWADHQAIRSRYPDALLLWSGEFTSYDGKDFWVTVVPRPFPTGADANAWCDGQGIAQDDCYAKRLLHTGTSAGTTVLRR
ncbi:zinc ribbon domain-containing protein [Lentzea sp. NPDC004789]